MTDPRPFVHTLRVRYADTDAQGIVYFANYLTFADEALSAWMRHLGFDYASFTALGIDFVFVDAQARYAGSARFEDVLTIEVQPRRVGKTSLVTAFAIKRGVELLVEGQLVQVAVARGEKVALPSTLREVLEKA